MDEVEVLDEYGMPVLTEWTEESIFRVTNHTVNNILACRTSVAVEAAITIAHYLNTIGLRNDNYPLYLKMLEIDNHYVIDTIVGDQDPFLLLTPIQPTRYMLRSVYRLLTAWHPGGIYPKTLSIVLGVLQVAYSFAKDGYKVYEVTINDMNNLGKHLNKDEPQGEVINRAILDIMDRISILEGQGDDKMELVARQCNEIRSHFFDSRKKMEDVIPQVLLVKSDYLVKEVQPEVVFAGN